MLVGGEPSLVSIFCSPHDNPQCILSRNDHGPAPVVVFEDDSFVRSLSALSPKTHHKKTVRFVTVPVDDAGLLGNDRMISLRSRSAMLFMVATQLSRPQLITRHP